MGFIVDPTDSGNVVRYGHRGEDPGVSAAVFHYPVREVDVVILGNQTGCVAEPLARLHGMLTE